MKEYDKLYDEEFFIIDSNNLNEIKTKLYGFAIVNENVFFNHKNIHGKLDGTGTYVYI